MSTSPFPLSAGPAVPGRPAHALLAVVTRGAMVDGEHLGSVAVVDLDGTLLWGAGDPGHVTSTRSALKPFQAVPLVASGVLERFGFGPRETALMCASHSGEPRHVEVAAAMLARAGNDPADLQCGSHVPGFYEVRGEFPPPPPYSPLAHNCSGKHSGMLAYCALCGLDKRDYLDFRHPLQEAIRAAVGHCLDVPAGALPAGIDGCSAPNYAVPLDRLALGFARLAAGQEDARYGDALRRIGDAMRTHPEMVSGEGRADLALMQAGRGDWVTKVGAEGVQGIGVRSRGIGIAVKVADGNRRGLYPAVAGVLDGLGLLDDAQRQGLAAWTAPKVTNYRGMVTGEVRPAVALARGAAFAPVPAPAVGDR